MTLPDAKPPEKSEEKKKKSTMCIYGKKQKWHKTWWDVTEGSATERALTTRTLDGWIKTVTK